MNNNRLTALRLLSLLGGISLLYRCYIVAEDRLLLKATLQLLGSIGVIQSIVLGSWKIRRILLQTHFPRLLAPTAFFFHLLLRSMVFCGMIVSLLLSFKMMLTNDHIDQLSTPIEGALFAFGLGLMTLWIYWWKERIQKELSIRLGVNFWRWVSFLILIFTRILFAGVGIVCTLSVVIADWLGHESNLGSGMTQKIQFMAGITLLLSSYLLFDRSIHFWLMKRFGRDALKTIRHLVALFTRAILLLSGSITMILVGGADWFGLDPTPGWGWPRRFQFFAGLLLVLSGIFLQNQFFKRWSYQMMGLKVLSSTQITVLILLRLFVVATGILITALIISADFLHLDPTPGWSESRFIELAGGLALIFSGFVSHLTSLLRWQLRRLFD